jgi:hypothetical protein
MIEVIPQKELWTDNDYTPSAKQENAYQQKCLMVQLEI